MGQGARICPRCSARVDERRARTSPYCLSCGAPLGTPPPIFAGKAPGGGGSALPWILGGIGLVVFLGIAGVIAIVAVASARSDTPEPVATSTAGPKLESTSTATVALDAGLVPPVPATRTARVTTPTPPPTVTIVRPTATPTPIPIPTPPPTVTPPPDAGVAVLAPFPRAQAQSEVDRVASGLASCKRTGGPFGAGSIRVDFEPDGRVGTLSRPPFSGTPVGSCISGRFLAIRVGKFAGSTQRIEKTFIIQE